MTTAGTGLKATVLYWADGSIEKVFQLLLAVLAAFGLRQRMTDELEVELNATNAQVTSSINGAVQILKACESEEQRQQYRIVMTAAAPPLVKKGDHSGLQSDVADVIGVNRKSVPYMESVQKRKAIDAAAAARKNPIAVGDTVCCKHGTCTLVEYSGPDNPCAVKICVDDHEHISNFDHAKKSTKKSPGGGSIRHAPVSFAHDGRKARKDKLPDYVKKQVLYKYFVLSFRVILFAGGRPLQSPLRNKPVCKTFEAEEIGCMPLHHCSCTNTAHHIGSTLLQL